MKKRNQKEKQKEQKEQKEQENEIIKELLKKIFESAGIDVLKEDGREGKERVIAVRGADIDKLIGIENNRGEEEEIVVLRFIDPSEID